METIVIFPLEIWDRIMRCYPLLPLYFVSKTFLKLLDNRYEHLSDWIQRTYREYYFCAEITKQILFNEPGVIRSIETKYLIHSHIMQDMEQHDLFSPVFIKYEENDDNSKIIITNKHNRKYMEIMLWPEVKLKLKSNTQPQLESKTDFIRQTMYCDPTVKEMKYSSFFVEELYLSDCKHLCLKILAWFDNFDKEHLPAEQRLSIPLLLGNAYKQFL